MSVKRAAGKVMKAMGKKKKETTIDYGPYLKVNIKSGMAGPAPPLGPQIGQRGINVQQFAKEFNKATEHMIPGIPCPTKITINPDRTFKIFVNTPTSSWFLTRAAGIHRGSMECQDICGKLSVKHIYEIAKIKSKDPGLFGVPLETVCRRLIVAALRMGIEIVYHLDTEDYQQFLDQRRQVVADQLQACQDLKQAKMQRTTPGASA